MVPSSSRMWRQPRIRRGSSWSRANQKRFNSMTEAPSREAMREEMRRTVFQKKGISRLSGDKTLEYAVEYFKNAGYRAGLTGRPGQMYIMGGKEGLLPRVTGEIKIQTNVGKGKVTMLTMDSTGEKLKGVMQEFHQSLRKLKPET